MINIGEAKDTQELTDELDLVAFLFRARIVKAVRGGRMGSDQVGLEPVADELT